MFRMSTRVYDLAHARAGDKGNTSNISVIARSDQGWQVLHREPTPERVLAFHHLRAACARELPQRARTSSSERTWEAASPARGDHRRETQC
jgi:hypothetical protein